MERYLRSIDFPPRAPRDVNNTRTPLLNEVCWISPKYKGPIARPPAALFRRPLGPTDGSPSSGEVTQVKIFDPFGLYVTGQSRRLTAVALPELASRIGYSPLIFLI